MYSVKNPIYNNALAPSNQGLQCPPPSSWLKLSATAAMASPIVASAEGVKFQLVPMRPTETGKVP